MAEGRSSSLPRWLRIFAVIVAAIGLAFAIWILASFARQSAGADAQRVRELAIAADNIAGWPRHAEQIANANLILSKIPREGASPDEAAPNGTALSNDRLRVWLYQPDLGDLRIDYRKSALPCQETAALTDNLITVSGGATLVPSEKRAGNLRLDPGDGHICFQVGPVALARLVPKPVQLKHLLIVGPRQQEEAKDTAESPTGPTAQQAEEATRRDHVIKAQIGSPPLPIRRMSELPKIDSAMVRMAKVARDTIDSSTGAKTAVMPTQAQDALEPTDSRVAGVEYRFYFHPLDIEAPRAGDESSFLVGVATRGVEPALAPGVDAKLIAFTLALALLIALVPVIKLSKLGPVDALRPIEVAAVVLGFMTAVALATGAWLVGRDVLAARQSAQSSLAQLAGSMATGIRTDLFEAARSPGRQTLAGYRCGRTELICGDGAKRDEKTLIDTFFVVDFNGRQPEGYPVRVNRDMAGATLELNDRRYFQRAIAGETARGSEQLRVAMGSPGTGLWTNTEGGLVVDQIRSRTDGVPRTVFAAAVRGRSSEERTRPAMIGATVLLPSMLAPTLPRHVRYAVIDGRAEGWPVLFHTERGRAHIEQFADSIDRGARHSIGTLLREPAPCRWKRELSGMERSKRPSMTHAVIDGPPPDIRFGGRYENTQTLFGAARVPCTDWVVLTFRSRDALDQMASRAAEHAVVFWAGIFILVAAVWAASALFLQDRVWCWLWPAGGARSRKAYRHAAIAMVLALAVGALVWVKAPLLAAAIVLFVALACLAWLALLHAQALNRDLRAEGAERLGVRDQQAFMAMISLLILAFAVVPVVALAKDAQSYFHAIAQGDDLLDMDRAAQEEKFARHEIEKVFRLAARSSITFPSGQPDRGRCGELQSSPVVRREPKDDGARPLCWASPIGFMRKLAGYDQGSVFVRPYGRSFGDELGSRLGAIPRALGTRTFWTSLATAAALILLLAISLRSITRGLFGFGVAFDSIDYPRLPKAALDPGSLPRRFMVIAAPDGERARLEAAARGNGHIIDLFEETRNPGAGLSVPKLPGFGRDSLLLFENLVVLLRDADRRRHALQILENAVKLQRDDGFRIAVIAELSPLDRLFHSYEREEEELEALKPEDRPAVHREYAKHREEMRWSRLFEEFTTYLYRAEPRPMPKRLPRENRALVRLALTELQYIPDSAVAPLLPGMKRSKFLTDHVIRWARNLPSSTTSKAVTSYLQSMLIEHYQFIWSNSSRAERLLLHHFAYGRVPNLGTAYPVRTLTRRGLVILDPYPRIVNRSFAEFVRHIEKPSTLKRWRTTAESGGWKLLRMPLMVILPAAFVVVAIAGISQGEPLVALLPLLVASGPALIQTLGAGRRVSPA